MFGFKRRSTPAVVQEVAPVVHPWRIVMFGHPFVVDAEDVSRFRSELAAVLASSPGSSVRVVGETVAACGSLVLDSVETRDVDESAVVSAFFETWKRDDLQTVEFSSSPAAVFRRGSVLFEDGPRVVEGFTFVPRTMEEAEEFRALLEACMRTVGSAVSAKQVVLASGLSAFFHIKGQFMRDAASDALFGTFVRLVCSPSRTSVQYP